MARKRRAKKHDAKFFGDNPRFKRGKERSMINIAEPWERQYAGIKKYKPAKKRKTKRRKKSFWRRF